MTTGRTRPAISRDNFRMDFSRPFQRFPLNSHALLFFVRDFLQSVAGGSYLTPPITSRYLTSEQVELALNSHLRHVKTTWTDQTSPKSKAAVEQRRLDVQNNTRKKTVGID